MLNFNMKRQILLVWIGGKNIKNKKGHLLLSLYNPNSSFIFIGSFSYGMHVFLVNLLLTLFTYLFSYLLSFL